MLLVRRRLLIVFVFALLASFLTLYYVFSNIYQLKNFLSYSTRPIWDTADGPKTIIPHYHADGLELDGHMCSLHGWKGRRGSDGPQVYDAILMSSELDLLEIRLNELDPVVDRFFLIESNATFTGLSKEKYYEKNRERFAHFAHKITYQSLDWLSNPDPWENELATRNAMTRLLRSQISASADTLVIMSDVDEIPSAHTIRLLKHCDFGKSIHLQLRNYVYSFEWLLGFQSWRASVHLWGQDTFYRHSLSEGAALLADSGWHCSYCFRQIEEFVIKMQGFSHYDRIGGRLELLEHKRIQDTICEGKDIFGMLPEAYTYAELLQQLNLTPQSSMVGLPRYLIENAGRFRFLLSGGCMRDP